MIGELQAGSSEHRKITLRVPQASSDVRASVAIQAEWRRILHALTVPEYMDLWLTMPGIERLECRPEQDFSGGFQIEVFLTGAAPRTIYGSCIRTRPDEISYQWEKARNESTAKSVVKMRLKDGPRRCSLHLTHCGLWNQKECEWYSMMWRESLDKLRKVMERQPIRFEYEMN
jgi:uncharacterized protein YndB with AHSA1/START domain